MAYCAGIRRLLATVMLIAWCAAGIGGEKEENPETRIVTVRFTGPQMDGRETMRVYWRKAGDERYRSKPLVTPGDMRLAESEIRELKLTRVPGKEGETFFATVEIGPATPRIEAFLARESVSLEFTAKDFSVARRAVVVKVVYLLDSGHEADPPATEEMTSYRLDPEADAVVQADRRGTILAVVRLGTKDTLEAEATMLLGIGLPGPAKGPKPPEK